VTEKTVPIEEVILDERCQARAEVSHETVTEYADAYRSGAKLPPVDVFVVLGKLYLVDGFHRLAALRVADESFARVRIVGQGDINDAIWHATSVNAAHGLRRSNADKRRAVELALRSAIGSEQSSRTIAEHVGVHHSTVERIRAEVEGVAKSDTRTDSLGRQQPAHKPRRDVRESDTSEVIGPEETHARIEAELAVDDVPEPLLYPHERAKALPTYGDELQELAGEIEQLRRKVVKLRAYVPASTTQRAEGALREAERTLLMGVPMTCRACGGEGCLRCGDRGWRPSGEVAS
jgi:transposase-like protein